MGVANRIKTSIGRISRIRRVTALCAAAGRVAGMRERRRGSVLVLILGGLAMLSIVAVVYVTVGQNDRRTGATTRARDSVQDTARGVGDYIARIIGDDATATMVDGTDPQLVGPQNPLGTVLVREAHDYPSTDYLAVTNLGPNTPAPPEFRFIAPGSYDSALPGNADDFRTSTDPWLAAPEPTWLAGPSGSSGSAPAPTNFIMRIDWGQLSNPAPSGNPVNLFNLRGNFDGEAGFNTDPFNPPPLNPATNQGPRMSDRLWLFDAAGVPTRVTWFGRTLTPDDARHPAYWTMGQQSAFRPARDVNFGPEEEEYLHYQYADADGDGMFDSRWFELVDVSDQANPISVLPKDGRFRWFVAPRIIDLSGRINVNTATDFRNPPTSGAVAGMSPADIDLLRILRMDDPARQYALGGQPLDYGRALGSFAPPLGWVLDQYLQGYTTNRTAVGHFGYEGLRIALRDFAVPPFGAPIQTAPLQFTPFTAAARAEYYRRAGAHGEQASLGSFVNPPPSNLTFTTGGAFGQADLLELLTYGGLNEPGEPSRLEAAIGGRLAPPLSGGNAQTAVLSPLRDNWPMQFERGRIDDDNDGLADDEALAMRALDPRPLLTTISHARPIVSQSVDPASATSLNADRELKIDAVAALEEASPPASPPVADANRLFAAYADALLPHSWREDAWDYSTANNPKFTLAYGGDPTLSIWAAAHMTANAIDMYDRDGATAPADKHEPSAFTLALTGDANFVQSLNGNVLFPFWATPRGPFTTPRSGVLDLDWALRLPGADQPGTNPTAPSRMARAGDLTGRPEAMNIFGVEAQPFIVEVASLTIYTDAPASAYPAGSVRPDEWTPDDPVTGLPSNNPITIRGDVRDSNPDIICQVLAFQITNPFDVDIGLGHADRSAYGVGATVPNDFGAYYIEFGGRFFRLAELDAAGTLKQVILEGRDAAATNPTRDNTRTFYILNDTLQNIQDRLADAAPAALAGAPLVGDEVRRIIEHQLSVTLPAGGPPGQRPPAPILIPRIDPASGATTTGFVDLFENGTAGPDAFKEVRLWRAVGTTGAGSPRENDLLADRIKDPSTTSPTLDRRLPDADTAVLNTTAGRDPTAGGTLAAAQDNTGFSILLWASYKRSDDPRGNAAVGQTTLPQGALPAYCLEPREQTSGTWMHAFNNHANPATPASGGQLDRCYFTGTPCPSQQPNTLGTEFLFRPVATSSLVSRLVDPLPQPVLGATSGTRSYINAWPEEKSADVIGPNLTMTEYYRLYPEIHLNDDRFTSGAGANATVTLRVSDMLLPLMVGPTCVPIVGQPANDGEWLTLGESLAVALNYSDPPASDLVYGFLHGLGGGPPAGPRPRPKSDRGQLVLNDFAPFEDVNNNGVYNPPVGGTYTDLPRWPGIPLALRVLDVFTATPRELGSIERGTPGLVNLNTAAPRAMQAEPMLRPNDGIAIGTPPMYWGPATHTGPVSLPNAATTDVASSLEAYRDKLEVETVVAGGATTRFDDLNRATLDDPSTWTGRNDTNRVPALREAPGFASVGEVLCATENPLQLTNRTPVHSRMDYLGHDAFNSGRIGVDSVLYGGTGTTSIDDIIDDFDEKLTIASAVTNTVTVRSDVFAVWFVLHGYQRSDVEGLSNTQGRADPLVPTIAKRYLMIVDRSNVTRKGDKPRILMMQELPL